MIDFSAFQHLETHDSVRLGTTQLDSGSTAHYSRDSERRVALLPSETAGKMHQEQVSQPEAGDSCNEKGKPRDWNSLLGATKNRQKIEPNKTKQNKKTRGEEGSRDFKIHET